MAVPLGKGTHDKDMGTFYLAHGKDSLLIAFDDPVLEKLTPDKAMGEKMGICYDFIHIGVADAAAGPFTHSRNAVMEWTGEEWFAKSFRYADNYQLMFQIPYATLHAKGMTDFIDSGKLSLYAARITYTVNHDILRVDNVFVDWSGWVHPKCTQEVPAFYTVSYLDNFYFYNGKKPWQDEPLQVRRDLIFWPEDWPRHRFPLDKENTETWAAWTDADDFGIGLYVPGAQLFIGGRYCHDGSKDPAAGPTNYVAPLYSLSIISYKPVTYSYLVTSGSLSEIRRRFKEEKDFADNASFRAYNE